MSVTRRYNFGAVQSRDYFATPESKWWRARSCPSVWWAKALPPRHPEMTSRIHMPHSIFTWLLEFIFVLQFVPRRHAVFIPLYTGSNDGFLVQAEHSCWVVLSGIFWGKLHQTLVFVIGSIVNLSLHALTSQRRSLSLSFLVDRLPSSLEIGQHFPRRAKRSLVTSLLQPQNNLGLWFFYQRLSCAGLVIELCALYFQYALPLLWVL